MSRYKGVGIVLVALLFWSVVHITGYAIISAPGAIPASGCREGAIMSTDQFTSTGISQVRTVGPGEQATAGAWVLADQTTPPSGVVATVNCPAPAFDPWPLFVVALQLTPTIGNWQDADIQELLLVQDANCNAQFEDGLDFTMQTRTGAELRASKSVTFFNGPQSPLFVVPSGPPITCGAGAIGILVVVKIGPNPLSGSQFGLMLEGKTADVPGAGIISSEFDSSRNPAGSSIRLQIIGGGSGGPPPPPPPTPGGGALKRFDTNSNNLIDDPEFFTIIDAWIAGQLNDQTFFQAVDIWVSQSSIPAAGLTSQRVELRATGRGVTFEAQGRGVVGLGVEVFDLMGRRVFVQEVASKRLSWDLRANDGQPVANGVYLYVTTVQSSQGQMLKSPVRKLVVLR